MEQKSVETLVAVANVRGKFEGLCRELSSAEAALRSISMDIGKIASIADDQAAEAARALTMKLDENLENLIGLRDSLIRNEKIFVLDAGIPEVYKEAGGISENRPLSVCPAV